MIIKYYYIYNNMETGLKRNIVDKYYTKDNIVDLT